MLRLRDPQDSLWDQLLPPQVRTLSAELTAVDEYLADDRFFEPYRQRFADRPPDGAGRDVSAVDVPQASVPVGL